jgi:hypothetical protein
MWQENYGESQSQGVSETQKVNAPALNNNEPIETNISWEIEHLKSEVEEQKNVQEVKSEVWDEITTLKETLKQVTEVPLHGTNINQHIDLVNAILEWDKNLNAQKNIIENIFSEEGIEWVINKAITFFNKLFKWLGMQPSWADQESQIRMLHNELRPLALPKINTIRARDNEQVSQETEKLEALLLELEKNRDIASDQGKLFVMHAQIKYCTDIKNHLKLIEEIKTPKTNQDSTNTIDAKYLKSKEYEIFIQPHIEPGDIVLINYKPVWNKSLLSDDMINKILQDKSQSPYVHVWMVWEEKNNSHGESVNTFYHSTLKGQKGIPWVEQHDDFKAYLREKSKIGAVQIMVVKPRLNEKRAWLLETAKQHLWNQYNSMAAATSLFAPSLLKTNANAQSEQKFNCGEYVHAIIEWAYGIQLEKDNASLPWTYAAGQWNAIDKYFIATAIIQYPPEIEKIIA